MPEMEGEKRDPSRERERERERDKQHMQIQMRVSTGTSCYPPNPAVTPLLTTPVYARLHARVRPVSGYNTCQLPMPV